MSLIATDATLTDVTDPIAAIIARFSLIHIPPDEVNEIFKRWADLLRPGNLVLIASQSSDTPSAATALDHTVAPAWRWHPDEPAEYSLAPHSPKNGESSTAPKPFTASLPCTSLHTAANAGLPAIRQGRQRGLQAHQGDQQGHVGAAARARRSR
jgi:hypothetical protein